MPVNISSPPFSFSSSLLLGCHVDVDHPVVLPVQVFHPLRAPNPLAVLEEPDQRGVKAATLAEGGHHLPDPVPALAEDLHHVLQVVEVHGDLGVVAAAAALGWRREILDVPWEEKAVRGGDFNYIVLRLPTDLWRRVRVPRPRT